MMDIYIYDGRVVYQQWEKAFSMIQLSPNPWAIPAIEMYREYIKIYLNISKQIRRRTPKRSSNSNGSRNIDRCQNILRQMDVAETCILALRIHKTSVFEI